MKKDEAFVELRKQAEKMLNGHAGGRERNLDLAELIHELEVHQVELELQNEELRRAQKELEASRNEYLSFYDSAPVGFVTLNSKGIVLRLNRAAGEILAGSGETLTGRGFSQFIHPKDQGPYYACLRKAIDFGGIQTCEVRISGKESCIRIGISAYPDETGNFFEWRMALFDITERRRAEEALRESEGRLSAIFQSAEEAIVTLDKEQRFLRANPAAGVITGVPHDQLIGRFLSDFVDPSFNLSSAWEDFLRSGKLKGEVPIRHSSGSLRVVEASGTANIGPARHLFVGHDITERKGAERAVREAHEYAENIIATVREPLVVLDADLRVVSTNRSFLQTFQVNKRETHGKLIYELGNRQWDIPRLRELLEGILPRNAVFENFEMNHDFPNLGRRTMLLNARRFYGETKATELILLAIEDITERKQVEEALRRSRDELELRVRERTADLELRNKELQNFVFVASHDLQEPLRKIQTFGDMLAAKCDVPLDEASRDYIRRMQRAASRMQDLLNSLLSYSRMTAKREPEDETDLGKCVKAALSNLEMMIREKNGCVEVGDLPRVRADQVRIIQLFQNLIENALKFHRDGEAPHIKVHAKEVGDAHEIYIDDNGIGFDEKYLDKIFLPFQRLHGRSSEYGGVGMGLAICKKIVERHGGKVTARSGLGKGSTFIVTLPANRKAR